MAIVGLNIRVGRRPWLGTSRDGGKEDARCACANMEIRLWGSVAVAGILAVHHPELGDCGDPLILVFQSLERMIGSGFSGHLVPVVNGPGKMEFGLF